MWAALNLLMWFSLCMFWLRMQSSNHQWCGSLLGLTLSNASKALWAKLDVYVSVGRRTFCSCFGGTVLVFDKAAVDGSYVRIVNLESEGSLGGPIKVGLSQCDQYFIEIFLIGDDHWSATFVWLQEDCFEVWGDDLTFSFRDVGFWGHVQSTFLFSSPNSFEKCQLLVPNPRWYWDSVWRSSYSMVVWPWYISPLNTIESDNFRQLWWVDSLVKCFSSLNLTCASSSLRGTSCTSSHVHSP